MVKITLHLDAPGGDISPVSFVLHPGYGATPAAAHEMVTLVIHAVNWPLIVLLTADGEPVSVPKAAITAFSTAHCDRV
jgi:hypothetical protein